MGIVVSSQPRMVAVVVVKKNCKHGLRRGWRVSRVESSRGQTRRDRELEAGRGGRGGVRRMWRWRTEKEGEGEKGREGKCNVNLQQVT